MKKRFAVLLFVAASVMQAQQPYLVKELNTTVSPEGSNINDLIALGNVAVFTVNASTLLSFPREVWRSDGTEAGTYRLGAGGNSLVIWNNKAWFVGPNGTVWSSDGTQPAVQFPLPSGLSPYRLIPSGSELFLRTFDSVWRTDGVAAPVKVMDLAYGETASTRDRPGLGMFTYLSEPGWDTTLYRGLAGGVQVVKFFDYPMYPTHFRTVGSLVYFYLMNSNTNAQQLWRSDGTAAGTYALHGGHVGPAIPVHTATHFYFHAGGKLWWTTGTPAGTGTIATFEPDGVLPVFPASAFGVTANGTVIGYGAAVNPPDASYTGIYAFNGSSSTFLTNIKGYTASGVAQGNVFLFHSDSELWRTDGTAGGTYKLADLYIPSTSWDRTLLALGPTTFMSASDGVHGLELFKTDGTNPGNTLLVEDIVATTHGSNPRLLQPLSGGVVFATVVTAGADAAETRDLWYSDGTAAGTVRLLEKLLTTESLTCGRRMFFSHKPAGSNGFELWSTNGTPAGTARLADIHPDSDAFPNAFECVDDVLYFFASDPKGGGLWRSDGTAPGTLKVTAFPAGAQYGTTPARFGHGAFYGLRVNHKAELWASDGTPGGTNRIKTLADDSMSEITVAGYHAFFSTGYDGNLMRTDGTAAGTVEVPGSPRSYNLREFNGQIFFGTVQNVCPDYFGLARTDGISTQCVDRHAYPGGYGFQYMRLNGRLWYGADLLKSTDGVSAQTSDAPRFDELYTAAGGRLYYRKDSGLAMLESDGTAAGTRTLLDRQNTGAMASGGRLFIASDELWAYDLPVTPTTLSPATVPPGGGQVVINGRGFTGPASVIVEGIPASVVSVTPTAITFTAPPRDTGTYEVRFTTADGREMTTDERLSYSCARPTATVGAAPAAVCPMVPVQLQGGGGTRCAWYPSFGLDNPSSCTPVAIVPSTTTYTLIASNNGCASNNNPTVTVTVVPKPSAEITTPASMPPGGTYTASVPDAGSNATYAWTVQGADLSGPANVRTVSFITRCEIPKLSVTVTNSGGCTASATKDLILTTSLGITSVSTTVANVGRVVTVTGSGFDCLTSVALPSPSKVYPITYTVDSPTSLTFRMPYHVPWRTWVQIRNPFTWATANTSITRFFRDDFGDDMTSDLVLRDSNTGQAWVVGLTPNGTQYPPAHLRGVGATDYKVVAVYDFGGYMPYAEVLWQQTSTRQFWLRLTGSNTAVNPIPAADQVVAAVGDLDGNGYPDLVMRNTTTGATQRWSFGGGFTASVTSIHGGGNLSWQIIGARDFNGDGRHDLLWRNSTGATLIWFMNGSAITSSQLVHNGGNTDWTIAALGDFDADFATDILWRHNASGMTLLWRMNGAQILQSLLVHSGGNQSWNIVGAGDFNADGRSDVLWRESQSGMTLYWPMSGAQIKGTVVLFQSLDPAVKIESPRM